MRSFIPAVIISLAAFAVAKEEAPTDLHIETTFMPEDCKVKAKAGDKIKVHYTGTLFDTGVQFDSSIPRGNPLPLTLGVGQVIKGWDQGLLDMCVGEHRKLTIPAFLAYGERGAGGVIPPNAALVFTTELVSLDSKSPSSDEL
ncbi:hypothetical protein CYLTODRAFT_444926 [Cylindrobasidium torrendii FP15055 ss-10]|uniref:peptidylprolyl isomerase n=1 Tax=Cylindrobasidium torrendii FP15055 ss-10 TaxID=1314674 RepID=A0A0D7B972_9AGAR|nr:hypothetical protein CYLTODRAFT_444926 [Cylindrobasidium torrendii FP15055 ss-10]